MTPTKITVCRKEHFNAAHRLYNPGWTDEQNKAYYGKCNNPNYHGHNYDLTVKVTAPIDPETGYAIDMKHLSQVIQEHVLERLDHKNLNMDVPEFQQLIPSAENIAVVIYNILKDKLGADKEIRIILYETERNFVEYPA